jgi:hypothetical protein
MLRYEGNKLPAATYAVLAGGGVILATLPLSHLFSPRVLILSGIISLLIAALMGVSSSIAETASFFAAFLLSLTVITLFSANAHPLQENTLVAVLPGVFAAFRPKLALVGFGLTLLILTLFFDRAFILEIVSVFFISACIAVLIAYVTTYVLREAGTLIKDQRALILRIVAILFLFYIMTTLYFASIYQMVGARDVGAFSLTGTARVTFLDYFFYAAMISTHGATNFLTPTSLVARFTTAVHMLVAYGFTTIYLATAVSVIASHPRSNHAP